MIQRMISLFLAIVFSAAGASSAFAEQRQPGEARIYYASGALKGEFPYIQGRLDGTVRWYYESGGLGALLQYRQNRLDGVVRTFYENGRLSKVICLKDNQPVGYAKYFADDGHVTDIYVHRNGMAAVRWFYDESGKILWCENLLKPLSAVSLPEKP